MSPEIILTLFLVFFVVFCLVQGFFFVYDEILAERKIDAIGANRKYESPKARRDRLESK